MSSGTASMHVTGRPRVEGSPADQPLSRSELEKVRQAYAHLRLAATRTTDPHILQALDQLETTFTEVAGAATTAKPVNPLSRRELDVLAWVAIGLRNTEIAVTLEIAPETVKGYLRNAMQKLGAGGRQAAVMSARESGLLP